MVDRYEATAKALRECDWSGVSIGAKACLQASIELLDVAGQTAEELSESDAVLHRLAKILAATAVALKGPEKVRRRHGYADLPDLVAALKAERDALAAQVEELGNELLLTRQAAHRGMDAAKKGSTIQLQLAQKARAESSPDALASEREANAILTAENERLAAQVEALKVALITIAEFPITQLDHRFPQDAVNMQIVARETLTREGLIYNVRKEQQP